MPFNVQFGKHEEPRIRARSAANETSTSNETEPFLQGLGFGAGVLFVLLVAYAIAVHVTSFPDLQGLQTYWLAWR